jgi:DNA-binding transcriptional regulator YdaS (Cro superfamily)
MDGIDLVADYIKRGTASQAQLARDVECSESHLSLVLARKRGLSAQLAKRISTATGVSMRELRPDLAEVMREVCQ